MSIKTISLSGRRIIITDVVVIIFIYFIPAFSHLTPFPFYFLDPMRIILLSGYLMSRNKSNAYILAITIPLFSMLVSGHPTFYKAILISIELFINIWLFINLLKKTRWPVPLVLFLSILVSKLVYYTLKFVFISFALLQENLVSTSLLTQLFMALFITFIFSFIYKNHNKAQG